MILWLGLLFSTIGIAASDFFCINLSTIANILGMSESMAGVTFLALGNGSPDVFSTFAAMSTNSGSLAVGELIGAAGFISAVVAGSMALVRPFRVARKSFVRDVGFFIVAASFSMLFLADGYLHLWECAVMVAFYVFYVITVVIWHWYLGRRRLSTEREGLARQAYLVAEEEAPEIRVEADDPIGHAHRGRSASRRTTLEDFAALESGGSPYNDDELDEEADGDTRDRWMAEISRNMRVSRPAPGERWVKANPIRPSLVGALEFRALLSSLNKSRNHQSSPISLRRYSDDPSYTLTQQQQSISAQTSPGFTQSPGDFHDVVAHDLGRQTAEADRATRARAVSANAATGLSLAPNVLYHTPVPRIDLLGPTPPGSATLQIPSFAPVYRNRVGSLDAGLAPEDLDRSSYGHAQDAAESLPKLELSTLPSVSLRNDTDAGYVSDNQDDAGHEEEYSKPLLLSPRPPHHRYLSNSSMLLSPGTAGSSPAMPFPPYHDDPSAPSSRAPSIRFPTPSIRSQSIFGLHDEQTLPQKRVRLWPYTLLPPPEVLASTLFPTIYSWHSKTLWEKIIGVLAAPSVFLLAITLPVVEAEKGDDVLDSTTVNPVLTPSSKDTLRPTNIPTIVPPVNSEIALGDDLRADQRRVSPNGKRQGQAGPTQTSRDYLGAEGQDHTDIWFDDGQHLTHSPDASPHRPDPLAINSLDPLNELPSSPKDWNRWLVCTQLFTAPFFVVLIVWANIDPSHYPLNLLLPALYVLIGSLVILAIVLLTTSETKPPRYRVLLCFAGFVVSIAWISTIANEVVGVLKAFGVIFGISDAILGLTIFAVGNSLGDLVADITVARLGYPVMALSACFGGPMLNILLGIGLSGLYMTIRDGNRKHSKHPGRPLRYKPYQIEVGGTLVISGVTLLVTLVGLLVAVPLNKWVMDRRIGWGLIVLWCLSTVGNLVLEVSGWGEDLDFWSV